MEHADPSTVILFASLHLDEETAPAFIEDYRRILREIAPSMICAELSPEQLDGSMTCHSKPEYAAAVLPVARELSARIVPIQMPTTEAREWERRMQSAYKGLEEDPERSSCLAYMRAEENAALEQTLRVAREPKGIEYFQTREYDLLHVRPHYAALERIFPELARLYEEWNEHFLDRIEKAVTDSLGETLMVIAGGHHKYWLWDRLEPREDIELHNLHSYRALENRPS